MSKLKPCPFCGSKAKLYKRPLGSAITCDNEICGSAFTNWRDSKDEAISEWNARTPQNEWISIDDELPAFGERVLAFDRYGFGVLSARYLPKGWYLEGEFNQDQNVTHWMPLPTPPKEI